MRRQDDTGPCSRQMIVYGRTGKNVSWPFPEKSAIPDDCLSKRCLPGYRAVERGSHYRRTYLGWYVDLYLDWPSVMDATWHCGGLPTPGCQMNHRKHDGRHLLAEVSGGRCEEMLIRSNCKGSNADACEEGMTDWLFQNLRMVWCSNPLR
jgi:hypothetical protein